MTIAIPDETAKALTEKAKGMNLKPEDLAVSLLRQLLGLGDLDTDFDEWEEKLRKAASDCGVSLPDEAVSRDGLYD